MFSLTIAFGPSNMLWMLLFKTEEAAAKAWEQAEASSDEKLLLKDDYGQIFLGPRSQINGLLYENLTTSGNAHVERSLYHHRLQAKMQAQAQADPALKAAMLMQPRGPGIPSPFPGRMNG